MHIKEKFQFSLLFVLNEIIVEEIKKKTKLVKSTLIFSTHFLS